MNKDINEIKKALEMRGYKGKQLDEALDYIVKNNISLDDLIDLFIAKADCDPHAISKQNCDSGKCMAWELRPQTETKKFNEQEQLRRIKKYGRKK